MKCNALSLRTLDFCIPRYGETHFWERAEAVPNRNLEASPVRNVAIGLMGTLFLLSGAGMYYLLAPPAPPAAPPTALPSAKPAPPEETAGPPALPETDPPPGLPIVLWGKRGHFIVIRNPRYLSAAAGDRLLFA